MTDTYTDPKQRLPLNFLTSFTLTLIFILLGRQLCRSKTSTESPGSQRYNLQTYLIKIHHIITTATTCCFEGVTCTWKHTYYATTFWTEGITLSCCGCIELVLYSLVRSFTCVCPDVFTKVTQSSEVLSTAFVAAVECCASVHSPMSFQSSETRHSQN